MLNKNELVTKKYEGLPQILWNIKEGGASAAHIPPATDAQSNFL